MDTSKIRTGEEFLLKVREEGGQSSDGPLGYEWQQGFAVHPFGSKGGDMRAHWWTRRPVDAELVESHPQFGTLLYEVQSLCGRHSYETTAVKLLGPGNVDRCKHCERKRGLRVVHRVR